MTETPDAHGTVRRNHFGVTSDNARDGQMTVEELQRLREAEAHRVANEGGTAAPSAAGLKLITDAWNGDLK